MEHLGRDGVANNSIALGLPAGKTLDKITGTFNDVPSRGAHRMIAGKRRRLMPGRRMASTDAQNEYPANPVPDTSPAANP